MPDVQEDLIDGLRISHRETKLMLTRVFHCTALPGTTATDKLANSLTLTATGTGHTGANIPEMWESFTAGGITFYCKARDPVPFGADEATVTCNYDTDPPPVAGFGPIQIEVGAALEQAESDFDWDNLQLPFASRSPIKVQPPDSVTGEPAQSVRAPILLPRPCIILTRQESSSPEPRSDGWVGWTNSDIVRGKPANTLLMLDIRGRNAGDGIWLTTYHMARDPTGKWEQIARWRNPDGTFPEVTTADLAAGLGIKSLKMQGSKAWAPLNLG